VLSVMKSPPSRLALILLTGVLAAAAMTAGYYLRTTLDARAGLAAGDAKGAGDTHDVRRPDFSLPDPQGEVRHISEWDGKLLVVNFWATWCPPCLHEIPAFMKLQTAYADRGVQFLGIAIDDPENVREFARDIGLNYPTLHGQLEAIDLARAFGNSSGALPYTVVIDREGFIARRHAGPLSEEEAEAALRALL